MEIKELIKWHGDRAREAKGWANDYRHQQVYRDRFKRVQDFHEGAVSLLDQAMQDYHDEDVALEQLAKSV